VFKQTLVNKKVFNIISIVLVIVGISSGLIILYGYLNNPHLLSREQALDAVSKATNWNKDS
jgi:uncharacterized protein YpmB